MIRIKEYLLVAFKGMCMGAADVIPGVSGGTIAFLMGIYSRLIGAINSINKDNLKLLFRFRIKDFFTAIDGAFLCSLFAGILISFFSLAKLMTYLLEYHPIPLWSFFFGLILASIIIIIKDLDGFKLRNILAFIAGTAIASYICLVSPSETSEAYWFIFVSGAIAICAMILPGISGSFILLLLGKYKFLMDAVATFNIPVLIVFFIGAVLGILAFSRFLGWLLKRWYMPTIALLSGFMLGSLIKVWPWKAKVANAIVSAAGDKAPSVDYPILPSQYSEMTGNPDLLGSALLFAVIGIAIVIVIELAAKRKK